MKQGGLGRNLSALLGQSTQALAQELQTSNQALVSQQLMINLVPGQYQPRRAFDEEALTELADSIKKQGLLQPLVVRQLSSGLYEIIAGERRWRACQRVGMTQVPVLVRQVDDETALALALVENLQREELSALEQARSMQRLVAEFSLTHQQIAELLSKSRTAVSNYLRLLNLAVEVQEMLDRGELEMGHARTLVILTASQQRYVAQMILAKKLSVRETERLVARVKAGKEPLIRAAIDYPQGLQPKLEAMAKQLQTEIRLKPGAQGRGTLVIHYPDLASLDQIMAHILK